MGPRIEPHLDTYGFYPAGGGCFRVDIEPVATLTPLHLGQRTGMLSRQILALVASLPKHIAQRECETAARLLDWGPETHGTFQTRDSPGPGNVLMIHIGSEQVTEVFTAFGELGISAEMVASTAAKEVQKYLDSQAVAAEHLADQMLLPMALAGAGSFTSSEVNSHAVANMETIAKFLPVRFEVQPEEHFTRISVLT